MGCVFNNTRLALHLFNTLRSVSSFLFFSFLFLGASERARACEYVLATLTGKSAALVGLPQPTHAAIDVYINEACMLVREVKIRPKLAFLSQQ